MKITNDVNNNLDFLSLSSKEEDDTSLLGSLFSISFNNNEIKSNNVLDDFEFVIKEDDIKIIDYLSKIIPNLNITNLEVSDLKSLKGEINSDQSIKSEIKDKILRFLDSAQNYNKNIFIKFPEHRNLRIPNNKNISDYNDNPTIKKESLNVLQPVIKSIGQDNSLRGKKSLKENSSNKSTSVIIESEKELDSQKIINPINKKVNFVKKIIKNDHPNKLYQLSNSNSFQFKEKIDSISLTDSKLSNTNLNNTNTQITDDQKKNKMNEIKVNDKISNIQNSIDTGSKGNQFSQQNNTSLANGGFNSVLEGLLETLDLTQKGWTTRLVSRIENALANGGEEIEFNLKPRNLGRLKVSISLKNGIGNVKIITENTYVTSALTQNENHLQKLFNDQGIELEFLANDESQYFGSRNSFNKNSHNNNQNSFIKSEDEQEQKNLNKSLDDNVSSRHIINVTA